MKPNFVLPKLINKDLLKKALIFQDLIIEKANKRSKVVPVLVVLDIWYLAEHQQIFAYSKIIFFQVIKQICSLEVCV